MLRRALVVCGNVVAMRLNKYLKPLDCGLCGKQDVEDENCAVYYGDGTRSGINKEGVTVELHSMLVCYDCVPHAKLMHHANMSMNGPFARELFCGGDDNWKDIFMVAHENYTDSKCNRVAHCLMAEIIENAIKDVGLLRFLDRECMCMFCTADRNEEIKIKNPYAHFKERPKVFKPGHLRRQFVCAICKNIPRSEWVRMHRYQSRRFVEGHHYSSLGTILFDRPVAKLPALNICAVCFNQYAIDHARNVAIKIQGCEYNADELSWENSPAGRQFNEEMAPHFDKLITEKHGVQFIHFIIK